jgi:peptidoglycan/LPS O-acetylase OafA/YrhL
MSAGSGYQPRYDALDAWRGVACLMVVLHHSGYFALSASETIGSSFDALSRWWMREFFRLMELGVPLFFVISGYCIGASMDRHRLRGNSSWGFLARRFRRIYPPYWASVLVFATTVWSLDKLGLTWLHHGQHSLELTSPGKLDGTQWLGNITLTETWRQTVLGGSPIEVFTRVAWSLCFEEQFYFVGFLVLLLAPRRLHAAMGWLTLVIVAYRAFAYDSGWIVRYRGTFLERWHEFAVGLFVYWRLVEARSSRQKILVDASLAGLWLVGLLWSYPSTAVAAAFGLLLIALRRFDERPKVRTMPDGITSDHIPTFGFFATIPRVLKACGRRSYSIYLIHLPVCTVGNEWLIFLGITGFWPKVLVLTPVVSTAAVGAGWMFFRIVESSVSSSQLPVVSSQK